MNAYKATGTTPKERVTIKTKHANGQSATESKMVKNNSELLFCKAQKNILDIIKDVFIRFERF